MDRSQEPGVYPHSSETELLASQMVHLLHSIQLPSFNINLDSTTSSQTPCHTSFRRGGKSFELHAHPAHLLSDSHQGDRGEGKVY